MHGPGIKLKDEITLDKLHSVHYFEFTSNYTFPGEDHDFWEMVYVDRGKINVVAGDECFVLESGHAYFHRPNQWHTLVACEGFGSNIAVITFSSRSSAMDTFSDLNIKITAKERQLIADILSESKESFITEAGNPYKNRLYPRENARIGSQQMIKLHLLELLVMLLRRQSGPRISFGTAEEGNEMFHLLNCLYYFLILF